MIGNFANYTDFENGCTLNGFDIYDYFPFNAKLMNRNNFTFSFHDSSYCVEGFPGMCGYGGNRIPVTFTYNYLLCDLGNNRLIYFKNKHDDYEELVRAKQEAWNSF